MNESSFLLDVPQENTSVSPASAPKLLPGLLSVFFLAGLALGSWLLSGNLASDMPLIPVFLSGVPGASSGFVSLFVTFFVNSTVFLLLLFFSALTVLGVALVPLVLLFRGLAVGFVLSSCLSGALGGAYDPAFLWLYAPFAAFSIEVLLSFAARALRFSNCLRESAFRGDRAAPDLRSFIGSLFGSFGLAAGVSALCGLIAEICGAIF